MRGSSSHAAEALIGVLIIALAVRLLARWRRGLLRVRTRPGAPRSVPGAYGIGALHGVGGSAGVGILLLAAIPDRALAIAAPILFAAFSAASMALCTGAIGAALGAEPMRRALDRVLPALGVAAAAFGAVYLAGALGVTPHPA